MTLPKRLKSIMAENNISQSTMASEIGVGQTTISNYLSGKNKPKKSTIITIAKFLNVSEEWLSTGEGKRIIQQEMPRNERYSYLNRKIKELKALTEQDLIYITRDEQLKMLRVYTESIVKECEQILSYVNAKE